MAQNGPRVTVEEVTLEMRSGTPDWNTSRTAWVAANGERMEANCSAAHTGAGRHLTSLLLRLGIKGAFPILNLY